MSIYVEILVRAPMDALWNHTQTAGLLEKWDLRFSRITASLLTGPRRSAVQTRAGSGGAVLVT